MVTLYIGYMAAILTTFAFLPQAIKTIQTRDTSGLSGLMYACFTVGLALWFSYGLLIGDIALICANGLTLLLALPVLLITVQNNLRRRRSPVD
ncbi:MAG: hypothetical protein GC184_03680 [Rhizobiales bacterium]|nr:hypothetical protein [Hyphomicrobiales bacterium]